MGWTNKLIFDRKRELQGILSVGSDITDRKKREEHLIESYQQIGIINRMGFGGYFLIVADFIKWAKQHDIPVGPGRGSGAGSLVAYALTIAHERYSQPLARF